jgi:hypothetical protein
MTSHGWRDMLAKCIAKTFFFKSNKPLYTLILIKLISISKPQIQSVSKLQHFNTNLPSLLPQDILFPKVWSPDVDTVQYYGEYPEQIRHKFRNFHRKTAAVTDLWKQYILWKEWGKICIEKTINWICPYQVWSYYPPTLYSHSVTGNLGW